MTQPEDFGQSPSVDDITKHWNWDEAAKDTLQDAMVTIASELYELMFTRIDEHCRSTDFDDHQVFAIASSIPVAMLAKLMSDTPYGKFEPNEALSFLVPGLRSVLAQYHPKKH